VGQRISYCTVTDISKARQYSPNLKYSIMLKVGNINSICVLFSDVMFTFYVHVCLAVISLTAFSHGIFKHKTIVT